MAHGTTPPLSSEDSRAETYPFPGVGRATDLAGSELDRAVSEQARRSLAHVLAWREPAAAADSRRYPTVESGLTPTGSPLEFVFSSDRAAIRYTAEVEEPGTDPSTRLATACSLYRDLSGHAVDRDPYHTLARLQQGPLRFGAWFSGRHDPTGDRYKLYAEIADGPEGADAADRLRGRLLGPERLMTTGVPQLRLVGFDPARNRIELYYRVRGSRPEDLFRLMHRVGFEHRFGDLLDAVRPHARDAPEHRLPGSKFGLSYSVEVATSTVLATTIFFSSRRLWGSDAQVERQFRSMASAPQGGALGIAGSLPAYLRFIDSLPSPTGASARPRRSRHNIAAFAVAPIGPVAFQLGVAAPWP